VMECDAKIVNYFKCPIANVQQNFIGPSKHVIRFDIAAGRKPTLAVWERDSVKLRRIEPRTRKGT
jgi:hypothetical protein